MSDRPDDRTRPGPVPVATGILDLVITAAEPAEPVAPTERELVARVREGDTEAFDDLVRRHLPRARMLARRLMRNADDADDLVQEAFLRAFERLGSFDASRPFAPWFTRLLVNLGIDHRRKRQAESAEPREIELLPGRHRADAALERGELRRAVDAALAGLPERQRLIVTMFELDGLGSAEIADELGIAQVTVRWHLHQARRALREALKGWAE